MKKLTNSLFLIGLVTMLSLGQMRAFTPAEISNWAEATRQEKIIWFETAKEVLGMIDAQSPG